MTSQLSTTTREDLLSIARGKRIRNKSRLHELERLGLVALTTVNHELRVREITSEGMAALTAMGKEGRWMPRKF
ncbi:hypothetical protein HMPREF2692_06880 [Corynebacterium sp. HMSC036D03]|uniref:hypothetical protein n=1 Tax=Corynebacterium sp. HMSC036D03 TaxID=1715171 RepID=UPI0008A941C7|nr:hypothetical protein [Corynebacterium sp. HMSC036D03]OHO67080.1 hypothetical protein HMPREF2692_06880 [Corynebacterium sp. HMSC036D03]